MNRSIWMILVVLTLSPAGFSQSQTGISIRGKLQQLALYGTRGNPPILLSSGDLGWAGLVEHVAEFLSGRGYFIAGVNSKAYLSSFTTKTSARPGITRHSLTLRGRAAPPNRCWWASRKVQACQCSRPPKPVSRRASAESWLSACLTKTSSDGSGGTLPSGLQREPQTSPVSWWKTSFKD